MPTVYINDQRYLCVGDHATFLLPSVTGQDSNLISGVIEYDWGHWCVGQVPIRDEDRRWIPNLTLISATREVELPTELWSVITDVETTTGSSFERAVLTSTDTRDDTWLGLLSTYSWRLRAQDIVSFKPILEVPAEPSYTPLEMPNTRENLESCKNGDVIQAVRSFEEPLTLLAIDGGWEVVGEPDVTYDDIHLLEMPNVTAWKFLRLGKGSK